MRLFATSDKKTLGNVSFKLSRYKTVTETARQIMCILTYPRVATNFSAAKHCHVRNRILPLAVISAHAMSMDSPLHWTVAFGVFLVQLMSQLCCETSSMKRCSSNIVFHRVSPLGDPENKVATKPLFRLMDSVFSSYSKANNFCLKVSLKTFEMYRSLTDGQPSPFITNPRNTGVFFSLTATNITQIESIKTC